MATKIEDHKYSIEEAFSECFYVIPDYQREYVWTEKEVDRLLEDIDEQLDTADRREYFIGTILVSPGEHRGHFEVIDGQQRLTTLFLLLCALRKRFKGQALAQQFAGLLSTSYTDPSGNLLTSLKLEPRYENAGDLLRLVVAAEADPETTRGKVAAAGLPNFGSLDNLLDAYAVICAYLDTNYPDTTRLKAYWGYLANNVVFIQISTDISSALKIFETINERGVGLDSMDLLKNLLFTQVRPADFTRLKDQWKRVTGPLEQAKEKPLRFLRYFLMANYTVRSDWRDGVIREDEIYDWLVDKENVALCGYRDDPFAFVRKIIRNVDLFIGFTKGLANDGEPSAAMDSMQRLCGAAFSLHYMLLLAVAPFPRTLFDHFVRQLESFLFFYIFTKTPTKDLERSFSLWADELRQIADIHDFVEKSKALDGFVAERFQANMDAKRTELADSLRRYSLGSMQQYRTRYLLAKLTQYVEMSFKGMTTPGPLGDFIPLEIEHILPNNPTGELRTSFAHANPGKLYDEQKAKLGNLTLLEKPINIVASNDFFALKKPEYAKSANYLTRSIVALAEVGKNSSITRINSKLASFDDWSAAAIEKRQDLLIGLAAEIWKTAPDERP
jgi:hypothetical protein